MSAARACLLVLPVLLLSGCFDFTEEVFVEGDGTARVHLEVAVLEEALTDEDAAEIERDLQEAKGQLERLPDVARVAVAVWRADARRCFSLDVQVTRVEAVGRLFGEGGLRLEAMQDGRVRYVRELNGAGGAAAWRALDLGEVDDDARAVAARSDRWASSDGSDFFVTFRAHGRRVESSSGGDVGRGDVTWRWSFAELDRTPLPPRLEAVIDTSRSWLLPIAGGLGLGLSFLWLRKKWRQRAN